MPSATRRKYAVSFIAAAATTDTYNQTVENWATPTTLATVRADVRFGTGQERREAAQESASQAATFECVRTPTLEAVPVTARIAFDGSQWDITGRAPLDHKTISFTGARRL
jgi:head-tail adaptor